MAKEEKKKAARLPKKDEVTAIKAETAEAKKDTATLAKKYTLTENVIKNALAGKYDKLGEKNKGTKPKAAKTDGGETGNGKTEEGPLDVQAIKKKALKEAKGLLSGIKEQITRYYELLTLAGEEADKEEIKEIAATLNVKK